MNNNGFSSNSNTNRVNTSTNTNSNNSINSTASSSSTNNLINVINASTIPSVAALVASSSNLTQPLPINSLLSSSSSSSSMLNTSSISQSQIASLPPPPPPPPIVSNTNPSMISNPSLPLSSSLPSSLSNTFNIGQPFLTSPISISQTTNSTQDNKMDTSCPLSSKNYVNDLSSSNISTAGTALFVGDVISRFYPNVNQQETPLPRQWSTIHKCQTLNLTNGNLRVTYKGPGKTHKDAASVRTDYPIPAACGIYYYEVKIISKGRDGYMGIGLSKSDVLLNRLPGWDKNSYGYHGDDGHSFCCSGTGQNYGPTFTTNDIIGCCLNLIENTCFYTKNGYNLGIAFRDLPSDLYPTVGLQTPLESVEANFGQYPFEFDIHNYVKEWHMKTRQAIERFPLKKENENNLPTILRKLISTYLVHHGYSSTAEAFAKSVGHVFEEELASIRNRQKIQKLVLNGNIAEAIELTYQLFPGILERNTNLLFILKVRQFIEMINDAHSHNNKLHIDSNNGLTKSNTDNNNGVELDNQCNTFTKQKNGTSCDTSLFSKNSATNCVNNKNNSGSNDEEMEMDSSPRHYTQANKLNLNETNNKTMPFADYNDEYLQKILQFGRELFQITLEHGENSSNSKILRDAFSLLAYHDPWNSPLGYQLEASQREPISAMLNSAILEANNMPRIPPLEVVYGQTNECMRLMSKYGIAWCAYVNLADYMQS